MVFYCYTLVAILFKVPNTLCNTLKPVLSGRSKRMVFNTDYGLMQVKSIAECSPWSILQYSRPPLSYHFPLRPWFCRFLKWPLKTGFIVSIQYDEHLCKIMLNLDQWLRFCLKVYSIFSSGGHFI